jgi:hypothetical protein
MYIPKIRARDLLRFPSEELWNILVGREIEVEFDDGTMMMSATELIVSATCWDFQRASHRMPLLKSHTINHHYRGNRPTKNIHVTVMNEIIKLMMTTLKSNDPNVAYTLTETVVEINNDLYNFTRRHCMEHVVGDKITDFIHLYRHPKIEAERKALYGVPLDQTVISDAIQKVTTLVCDDLKNPDGTVNIWSWLASRGLIKPLQLCQIIFIRGYIEDINNVNIPYPILDCYLTGMRSVHAYQIVARENATAVNATQDQLRKASTDSRRVTYVASYRRKIHPTDCGTTHTLPYVIGSQEVLNVLHGGYRVTRSGSLVMIDKHDTDLIGKTIQRRSLLTCEHPDDYGGCAICVGTQAYTYPEGVNVGGSTAKAAMEIIVQMKLSKKHYLSSASTVIGGDATMKKLFTETNNGQIYLRSRFVRTMKDITLHIPIATNRNITDATTIEDVRRLTLSQVTNIRETIVTITTSRGKPTPYPMFVDEGCNSKAMLSYEALEYISQKAKEGDDVITTEDDMFVISFKDFPFADNVPLMVRPGLVYSNDKATNVLMGHFERSGDMKKKISRNAIVSTLSEIVDLSIKLNLGLSMGAIEIILSGYLSRGDNMHITKGVDDTHHESAMDVLASRSLSVVLLQKDQKQLLASPRTILNTNRDDNPLDGLIDPVGMMRKHKVKPWALQDAIDNT